MTRTEMEKLRDVLNAEFPEADVEVTIEEEDRSLGLNIRIGATEITIDKDMNVIHRWNRFEHPRVERE